MTQSRTIRLLTLAGFCILLTAFILYRSGSLDDYIYNDQLPMSGSLSIAASYSDTTPPKNMFPSTKSAMVPDEWYAERKRRRDSIMRNDSMVLARLKIKLTSLSSSKSAPAFPGETRVSIKRQIDSLEKRIKNYGRK